MKRRATPYKRALLKLSGEMLAGDKGFGFSADFMRYLSGQVKEALEVSPIQLGIVIGGGNIYRGARSGLDVCDRATGDYMGMLATAINALALQGALESMGLETRVMSAIEMKEISEPYIRRRAVRHLEKGRVVIFACGTGNPFFTTDTAASLRAMEIGADVLLKGTKVNGVYDKDPQLGDAKKFSKVTFLEVLNQGLGVMDSAAISLCMDNELEIVVFDVSTPGSLSNVIQGEDIGTIVVK